MTRACLPVAAFVVCLPLWAYGQTQPRFQSGVEVTSVDVTVVDGSGRPVPDLRASDFVVRVDGEPRQIVNAEWIPRTISAAAPAGSPPPASSSNDAAVGGRLVVLLIDQPNIRPGGVIAHRAALNTFIDRLPASDRVAAISLGAGATSVSFGTDREQVKRVVAASVGGTPYPPAQKTAGDMTLDAIKALISSLRPIDVPKTVVLVSQGLTFSDYLRPSLTELERLAGAARTTIYVLRLAERVQDITQGQIGAPDDLPSANPGSSTSINAREQEVPDFPAGPAGDRGATGIEAAGELQAVAAATGGLMINVAMTADAALGRIESELGGRYQLGLESRPSDRDGKPHAIAVEVRRPDVTVRTGRYLPDARDMTRPPKAEDRLAAALVSPIPLPGMRLRVGTLSTKDADASHVRVLVRAEVGSGYTAPQPVAIGVVITDRDGAPVYTRTGTARLQPAPSGGSALQYSGSASIPPGDYTLKLAVVDGDRVGSVEHPFHAAVP